LRGIGETFSPDLQSGTGNVTVPIVVPAGRLGLEPKLSLAYSTGNGNGLFGLGWTLIIPGVSRKTARGVPVYDDERDTFVLSGEDLVPVETISATSIRYRARTEGIFARIVHHRDPARGQDYWEVTGRDGQVSRYGSPRPADARPGWRDPTVLADPADPTHVFAWKLTEIHDPLGNLITYIYDTDVGESGNRRWRQPLLQAIGYADAPADDDSTRFLATVTLEDEAREDAFSSYSAGFEIRTTRRYRTITTAVHTDREQLVRRYELGYDSDPYNGVSLLTSVEVVGFDDGGGEHRDLPPVTFAYSPVEPTRRRFQPVGGADPPAVALSRGDHELVDLTGDGLPDMLQLNGVARYWRNLGGCTFDRPRPLHNTPAGLTLADPGVQLLDADGDGRADLLVTTPTISGYFPLRFGPTWGPFRRYRSAPGFSLKDPEVRLIDLDGDGVTDALYAGSRLECFFSAPDAGWTGPRPARSASADGPPPLTLTDPRVRWADMTGDGHTDLVLVHDRAVEYWPNLGHGRWGGRVPMAACPQLPSGYDPKRLLLGDVDGDGLADLIYTDADTITVWFNRSGNAWSPPVTIRGLPADDWDVRITDLLGTGTGGILWSRNTTASGRPSMYFLDLTGGVKPRLLTEIDNHIGAVTRVAYQPSTSYSTADDARPATRWRTPLPFVLPVVSRVETIDEVSGGKLTSQYRYRHGYWDGVEREFRGFGCVEQTDTETFDDYHGAGLHPSASFAAVHRPSFSPPTLTRTWFHLGPVDIDADDQWTELDLTAEYWAGDPDLLGHITSVKRVLRGLHLTTGGSDRRARRDALRALRGRVLRTELYGLDASVNERRPYTVIEHAYDLREESSAGVQGRPRVFFVYEVAQRTTQWERGDDPMTRFTFIGDHDGFGQPRRQTSVALPRRSIRRRPLTATVVGAFDPDGTTALATHTRTDYAEPPPGVDIHDRVAQLRTYELTNPLRVDEHDPACVQTVLADQARIASTIRASFDALAPGDVRLIGHVVHHYDGLPFVGLDAGELDQHGLLTRSETLVLTDHVLNDAYGPWRPAYLGGTEPLPAGAPAGFGADLGYRRELAGPVYAAGWYADTIRKAYDVQLSTHADPLPKRGLVLGVQDPFGHESRVTPDAYWLQPAVVRNPAGLETLAEYSYRTGRPRRVVDPNGHATNYRYHPLGLLSSVFLEGRGGEGGTAADPEIRYSYDFTSFVIAKQPIHVHTTQRIWHVSDNASDEVIEAREYSDGFGRLVQKRAQADDLAFGEDGDDVALLVPDITGGDARPVPGQAGGPATGSRVPDRVVVSGWEVHDNKGRVIEKHEPFFDRGWDYQPEAHARRGRRVAYFYDPRGNMVRVLNPDGSQRRALFGVPADLVDPDDVDPTPWAMTAYDENDLALLSARPDGRSLANSVPVGHHFTPATTVVDALGRQVCQLARGGPDPAADWHATRTSYDLRGNVLTIVDQLGRIAFDRAYDLANRPLRIDSVDAGRRVSVLDSVGGLVQAQDSRGCVTLWTYDPLNRPVAVFARDQPGAALTLRERLAYGDAGSPAQPAADRAAARTANRLGRLWRHYDEAGLVIVDAYDFTGKVTAQVRQVVSDTAIAAAELAGWTANWAAPGADLELDFTDRRTTTAYDALGRPVEVTTPTGAQIVPAYSRSGALRSVTVDGTPYVRLLAHNARGQRVLIAYGTGMLAGSGPGAVTRYAYDPNTFRITRLRTERMTTVGDIWTGASAPLQDLTYEHDLVGNVATIEEQTTGCGVAGTADKRDKLVRTFGYDAFYRLVSATGRACADIDRPRTFDDAVRCGSYPTAPTQANAPDVTETYVETYRYDPVGNLLDLFYCPTTSASTTGWHRIFGMGGLPAANWADAPNNRLTSVTNGTARPTTIPYGTYDEAGNLLTENLARSYNWDHAGRLVGLRVQAGTGTSVSARYLYGADGMRVKKWIRRGSTAALDESTVYIGNLAENHRWAKCGGGENSLLHVLDGSTRIALIRTGDVHPDDAGPAIRFELADHLGSASLTLDDTGTWTNREEYFPYGETSFGSFSRKRYRCTGKERDEESGLAYHGARYYAPWLGRWISCDPAGPLDGLNLYQYSRANPCRLSDPTGTQAEENKPVPTNTAPTGQDGKGSQQSGDKDQSGGPTGQSNATEWSPSAQADDPAANSAGEVKGGDRPVMHSLLPTRGEASTSLQMFGTAEAQKTPVRDASQTDSDPSRATDNAPKSDASDQNGTGASAPSTKAQPQPSQGFWDKLLGKKAMDWGYRQTKFTDEKNMTIHSLISLIFFLVPTAAAVWTQGRFTVNRDRKWLSILRTGLTVAFVGLVVLNGILDRIHRDEPNTDDKLFDRWSLVHTLFGVVMGLWQVPFYVVALLTVSWELFEMKVPGFGQSEINFNRLSDIGVAWLGWLGGAAIASAGARP
jgi:RHS repeat-associated protein